MGSKITKLTPVGGFAAETAGAISLFTATYLGVPVSTTHTITGAIIGVGVDQAAVGRALGRGGQDRVGMDPDDSCGRVIAVGDLLDRRGPRGAVGEDSPDSAFGARRSHGVGQHGQPALTILPEP